MKRSMNRRFACAATGGTFDRLHKGHAALLSKAFQVAGRVLVGITSDEMVRREGKRLAQVVESFPERVKEVKEFLKRRRLLGRAKLFKIDDVAGPAKSSREIEAIVATTETLPGIAQVNRLRRRNGLAPVASVLCRFVCSEDRRHISSTRIRLGELDRNGMIYSRRLKATVYLLTSRLIPSLKKPIGLLVRNSKKPFSAAVKARKLLLAAKPTKIIAVGDVAVKELSSLGVKLDLGVADLKTERRRVFSSPKELGFRYSKLLVASNPASRITRSLVAATRRGLRSEKPVLVQVSGEEDLAVIPVVLFAPLDSVVIYGQPREGLVLVPVTEKKKKEMLALLQRFGKK